MGTLYLIRGLPGAGKTTLAKLLQMAMVMADNEVVMTSADDYMMVDGEYVWDQSKLFQAHTNCRLDVRQGMEDGVDSIIVHNTNTTERELKPYLSMAEEFGYTIVSLIVENRNGNMSVHNVPEETREIMKSRFVVKL